MVGLVLSGLNVTKADKKRFREKMKDSALSSFDEFRDLDVVDAGDDDVESSKVCVRCSVLQCVAVRCSVLQCVAMC